MKTSSNSFIESFEKTASQMPQWFQSAHKSMGTKSLKQHSKKGLHGMMKRRGLAK